MSEQRLTGGAVRAGRLVALAAIAVAVFSSSAMADGMIVPIRPDLPVQGSWAVKYHYVDIRVRRQVASVSISQEFVNTGGGMIEVEYLFPVPPGAAIDSMTLMVNGKEFAAKLFKADEARKIYEDIVRQKKDPALLEYAGFGLYRTRAFPLEPGKPAKVLVTYKNICTKTDSLVEVWYPLNTEKFSAKPVEDVKVRVDVEAPADITTVYSPSHKMDIERQGSQRVIATYQAKNVTPTTDLQLFYSAGKGDIGATLLTYQPRADQDGYFLMTVSPNPRTAKTKVVAKDIVLVLDRSGSMSGEKIVQAREAARFVLERLNENDTFNVIVYNDGVETLFEKLQPAKNGSVKEAIARLDQVDARGGTNIHEALKTAMAMAMSTVVAGDRSTVLSRPKYILFLTDGLPTVGNVNESSILADTKKANAFGARLFAFGVGYDVNVRLLDKLVDANHGRSNYVKPEEPIEAKVSSLYAKIKNPVMTNLKVAVQGVKLTDMYPRELGDLFEGDQLVAVGRYSAEDVRKLPSGSDARHSQLVLTGNYEGKERGFEYPVAIDPSTKAFPFVEKLWAVRRVGYLLDQIQLAGESKEVIDELVALSLEHGIMTPYTSFLADERVDLTSPADVAEEAEDAVAPLVTDVTGGEGQVGATNRQEANEAARVPTPDRSDDGVKLIGKSSVRSYEDDADETVANVRQVGNQALYRRGRVWVAANASKLDPNRDQDKIQVVQRMSDEYFALARANTVAENQILASQGANEELLIELRGQVYLIK